MSTKPALTQTEIREFLTRCSLESDALLLTRVETYLKFLDKWNARLNLTGIRTPFEILEILLGESFFAATLVPQASGPILDIGSGAGFPGLAMAMYRPEWKLILLEPRQKRAAFLTALRRELKLNRVQVLNRRLEECTAAHFPEVPAILTMRAIGSMPLVVRDATRFFRGSGDILLFSTRGAAKTTMDKIRDIRWSAPVAVPWIPEHVVLLGQIHGCST